MDAALLSSEVQQLQHVGSAQWVRGRLKLENLSLWQPPAPLFLHEREFRRGGIK